MPKRKHIPLKGDQLAMVTDEIKQGDRDDYTYRRTAEKTKSSYSRNERSTHWVWLAAHGSRAAFYVLDRMDAEQKRCALQFSTEDIKALLKAVLHAPRS